MYSLQSVHTEQSKQNPHFFDHWSYSQSPRHTIDRQRDGQMEPGIWVIQLSKIMKIIPFHPDKTATKRKEQGTESPRPSSKSINSWVVVQNKVGQDEWPWGPWLYERPCVYNVMSKKSKLACCFSVLWLGKVTLQLILHSLFFKRPFASTLLPSPVQFSLLWWRFLSNHISSGLCFQFQWNTAWGPPASTDQGNEVSWKVLRPVIGEAVMKAWKRSDSSQQPLVVILCN